ncbi:apolipoprotein N-acyltransferase [Magnetovibrio blakemorei]|uniref:Apolipoprotein N-acyltransferase n=1 Tax=Magnetovibrio blakemorei TaxID=28181 RepID=A0A1E5Q459_9PROT|nr:apolipoprotein N-acyltransferase [Magnetovibrio blakemorei]
MVRGLSRVHTWVRGLGRWQARALAFVLGALAVLAMPPTYQIYLLIPAFSGFLWLIGNASSRWRAFVLGWWFGAGFFGASLYWVSFALLVEADKFAWLIPISMFGFAFGLGLFGAVNAWVVQVIPGTFSAKALVLAGSWTLLEWVRSWIFTGLPWNPVGSVWAVSAEMMQGAAYVGVFGQSLLTVLVAASFAALIEPGRSARLLTGFSLLGLVFMWGVGEQRLAPGLIPVSTAVVPDVRLRLIQPNISQREKWKPELRERNMFAQIDLATAPPKNGGPPPTHIIWAETAAPFFIENQAQWRKVVASTTPPGGLTILGAPRAVSAQGEPFKVANSLLAFDSDGALTAHYDKFHLVPFGEYVPFADWLPLDKITQGQGGFTPGAGPRTLMLKGLPPVAPLICYEVIFPHAITDPLQRPQWILNLTNDAWYGKTAGPHQHFVSARLRAVEEGLPLVRVAFTGISAIVDAYGRVRESLPLSEKGFIDGDLPVALDHPGLYAQLGNGLPVGLSIAMLLGGIFVGRRRPAQKRV